MSPHLSVYVCLLLTVTAAAAQDLSRIVISPEDVLVYQGRTLILPCVAYLDTNSATQPTISWTKGSSPLTTGEDPRVTTRALVESNVSGVRFVRSVLEVCDVRPEDASQYSCILSTDGAERDSANFNITVTTDGAPTQVLVAPDNVELTSNQTVTLSCVAHAIPSPTISWSRNGHALSLSPGNLAGISRIDSHVTIVGGVRLVQSRLEMCNVGGFASGRYSCQADNELTISSADFQVAIPGPIQLLNGPSESKARVGSTHTMSCDFHGFPRPTVSWSGVPLASGGRFKVQEAIVREEGVEFVRSELSISPVADYDEGVIVCKGDNGEDQLEHSFSFDVLDSPQILVSPGPTHIALSNVSSTLTLACVGRSSSHITWMRNGLQVSNNDERMSVISDSVTRGGRSFVRGVLEVCSVSVVDSGEYSCMAVGSGGTDASTFDLCAIETTGLLIAPSDVTIATGHTLSTSCVGYTTLSKANSTRLQWTHDGVPLDTNDTTRMTILERQRVDRNVAVIQSNLLVDCIEPEAAGRYGCHVISDDVIKSEEFDIVVLIPPIIKNRPNSTYSVQAEGTVSFVCIATGDPLPTITWFKDSAPLNTDLDKRLEVRQTDTEGFDSFEHAVESVLTVYNAREDDAGYYRCKADNIAGETELSNYFQLLYDPTTDTSTGGLAATSSGLGHGSYIGNIVGVIFFLAMLILYLLVEALRKEPFTPALVNCCISLVALNVSYIASYNVSPTGMSCVILAVLFQYLFLVATLSLINLVLLQLLPQPETIRKKLLAHFIAFALNWGVPVVVVVVSVSPDLSNFTPNSNTHFCGPMLWPYWLGELLPLGVLHLPLWCAYLIISIRKRTSNGRTEWVWHMASTGSTLFLFDATWAIGLSSTQHTDTPLHAVFLVLSIIFGLFPFFLYCLAYRKARVEIMEIINRKKVSKKPPVPPASTGLNNSPPLSPLASELDALFQDGRAFSMSGIEAGKIVQKDQDELPSREVITSFADSIAKEDLGIEEEALSPDNQEDNGSDVFPCVAEVESINQSPPITSFDSPLEEKVDLAINVTPATESEPDLLPTGSSVEKKLDPAIVLPTAERAPLEFQYLPLSGADCSQEDDVFGEGRAAEVYVKERRYHSRTMLLSGGSLSDEGAWQHSRRPHPPSRQSSVTGPQIVRFALV